MPVELVDALATSLKAVTRDWTQAKRTADRQQRISTRELEHQRHAQPRAVSLKAAAWQVMEAAYLKASAQGQLPANARQVMYAARPAMLRLSARPWGKATDQYFTQHLLPDFMEAHPEQTAGWDVVFDDRGHFLEPHTGKQLGLGTLAVRAYILGWTSPMISERPDLAAILESFARIGTSGPQGRYGAVLFVEKEGFDALWRAVNLADRFDIAIMSTKGMSVTASRQLVERLSRAEVPLYVLHDFDKAGFSILHTLRTDTRRFRFVRPPQVSDLGLRLTDIEALGLESEPVEYDSEVDPRINLRESGATEAECARLVKGTDRRGIWIGERTELNAMDSQQLVTWLEQKLTDAGVAKVVPEPDTLAAAYRRAQMFAAMQRAAETVLTQAADEAPPPVPENLVDLVQQAVKGTGDAWDDAIWALANEQEKDA